MGDTHDLGLILDARIPIIVIESPDEKQVLELLLRFAIKRHLGFSKWSVTRGLRRGGCEFDASEAATLTEPEALLSHIAQTNGPAIAVWRPSSAGTSRAWLTRTSVLPSRSKSNAMSFSSLFTVGSPAR